MKDSQSPTWFKSLLEKLNSALYKDYNNDSKKRGPNFKVFKDSEGNYRWFGWVTNKFEDREEDILTDAAHVEFRSFLDQYPEFSPELWIWHTPGTAQTYKSDWWEYKNGFFMYSGVLEPEEAKAFEEDDPELELGMSHGFFVIEKVGKYILKYRTFEVSVLPLKYAANPYTGFGLIKEEIKEMFSTQKRAFLLSKLGEEKVTALEANTEKQEEILTELGVSWASLNEQYEKEIEEKLAERVASASKSTVAAIMKEVIAALNIEGLQGVLKQMNEQIVELSAVLPRLGELEENVKHLMETEDERIAKAITPAEPYSWEFRPTKKEGSAVEELPEELQKEVQDASGQYDWLKGMSPFAGGN